MSKSKFSYVFVLRQHNMTMIVCDALIFIERVFRACVYAVDCRSPGNYGNSTLHKGHKFTDIYIILLFSCIVAKIKRIFFDVSQHFIVFCSINPFLILIFITHIFIFLSFFYIYLQILCECNFKLQKIS